MTSKLDYSALGARIREARRKANFTQEQLGEICGLSTSYIGHIERGSRIASLDTVFKIASVLNVSVDYLLSDSLPSDETSLQSIGAMLKGKKPKKIQSFISVVKSLAENIDNL